MQYTKYVLLFIFVALCSALVLALSKEVSGHLNAVYVYIQRLFDDLWLNGLNNDVGRKAGFSLISIVISVGLAYWRLMR
jgi:hypothetical protein